MNTYKGETVEIINFDPIHIEQNGIKYDLNIEVKEDKLTFSINDKEQFPSVNYIRTMSFKEIKELNIIFNALNSFNDFYDYLKSLSENKKLNIKKNNDKFVEVLLKKQEIVIDLIPEKKNLDLSIKEIYKELLNMKEEINCLKNENKKLNNDVEFLKNENKKLNNDVALLKNENKELKIMTLLF